MVCICDFTIPDGITGETCVECGELLENEETKELKAKVAELEQQNKRYKKNYIRELNKVVDLESYLEIDKESFADLHGKIAGLKKERAEVKALVQEMKEVPYMKGHGLIMKRFRDKLCKLVLEGE